MLQRHRASVPARVTATEHTDRRDQTHGPALWEDGLPARTGGEEDSMGKTGRKRRARKKKGANHGKRPNA
jgi:hypothetical protein